LRTKNHNIWLVGAGEDDLLKLQLQANAATAADVCFTSITSFFEKPLQVEQLVLLSSEIFRTTKNQQFLEDSPK